MPRRCAVIGCLTKGSALNKSFYRFPNDNELCKKWIKALCNLQLVKIYETQGYTHLNKNKFVCSDHFETKHLRNVKAPSQGLFEGAVPSININLNMDALISSLKQSEMLNEISKTKKPPKRQINNLKRARDITPQTSQSKENQVSQELNLIKKIKVESHDVPKSNMSFDDVPLKQLYGGKVKPVKQEPDKSTHKQSTNNGDLKFSIKGKKTKHKADKTSKKDIVDESNKAHSNIPNKIVQVFLPTTKLSTHLSDSLKKKKRNKIKPKRKRTLAELKKKLIIRKMRDPLAMVNSNEPVDLSLRRKLRTKKVKRKVRRKRFKRKVNPTKKPSNFIKVVIKPSNLVSEEIKLSTQGPRNIIKMVVPSKNTNGKEASQESNQFIKVVVPKKVINGKEINLERSVINKILKLVSARKNLIGKGLQIGKQSLQTNKTSIPVANVSETREVEKNRISSENNEALASKSTQQKQVQLTSQSSGTTKILRTAAPSLNINGSQQKYNTVTLANGKVLKVVVPPKNIDTRSIRLIAKTTDNSNVLKEIPFVVNVDCKRIHILNQRTVINSSVPLTSNSQDAEDTDVEIIPPDPEENQIINLDPTPEEVDDRKGIKLFIQEPEDCQIPKSVSPQRSVDVKITQNSMNSKNSAVVVNSESVKTVSSYPENNSKIMNSVTTPTVYEGKKRRIISQFCESGNIIEKPISTPILNTVVTESLTNHHNSDDGGDFTYEDSGHYSDGNDQSAVSQNTENVKTVKAATPPRNVEVNPMSEELCKRIKFMIGQRFGDTGDTSDSDEASIPLSKYRNPQKTIKQLVESYRCIKNCSCDALYKEKMKNLAEEEKELKRKLKNVQKYVFHYKDNIRKKNAMVVDLKKQLPVKKPPKTGQLIKTVMPLHKVKEKNPGKYRFTKNLKTFALDLFYSSPLSYNILEKMYFLPSRKTLKNWLTNPKNNANELFGIEDGGGNTLGNMSSMNENMQVLNENMESVDTNHSHSMLVQQQQNMGHHQVLPLPPPHSHTHPHHPHHTHNSHSHSNHPHHTHSHSHTIETTHHTMGTIEDNIEPLQENIDDIMFRNDLAEAIMNS